MGFMDSLQQFNLGDFKFFPCFNESFQIVEDSSNSKQYREKIQIMERVRFSLDF